MNANEITANREAEMQTRNADKNARNLQIDLAIEKETDRLLASFDAQAYGYSRHRTLVLERVRKLYQAI